MAVQYRKERVFQQHRRAREQPFAPDSSAFEQATDSIETLMRQSDQTMRIRRCLHALEGEVERHTGALQMKDGILMDSTTKSARYLMKNQISR